MASFPNLEAALLQLTVPDTNLIKQAENFLKEYIKKTESVEALFTAIKSSATPQVSAAQLRCLFGGVALACHPILVMCLAMCHVLLALPPNRFVSLLLFC